MVVSTGAKCTRLDNRSTNTAIASFLDEDWGRDVIKSMEMDCHRDDGTGKGCNNPGVAVFLGLLTWHE